MRSNVSSRGTDTGIGAEINQHGLARFGRRREQIGVERLEAKFLWRLARIEEEHERRDCNNAEADLITRKGRQLRPSAKRSREKFLRRPRSTGGIA